VLVLCQQQAQPKVLPVFNIKIHFVTDTCLPFLSLWDTRRHGIPLFNLIDAALTLRQRRLQSVFMRKIVTLWVGLLLPFFSGCGENAVLTPAPQYQKLTLQDLKPAGAPQFQPQIIFDIVTFEIAEDGVKDIAPILAQFNPQGVRIGNKELFTQNGLGVYYGKGGDSDKLVSQLRILNARRAMRTSLMTMDKTDELFTTATFPVERYVFSTFYGNRKVGQAFRPGRIGFVITSSLTLRRDSIDVKVVPAYVPEDGANIRMTVGKDELGQKPFGQGRFEVQMREGDFLVLAPNRVPTETTLDKMLFGPQGAKNKMRLYVILFVRVGQE
jgi:hypothetical protein